MALLLITLLGAAARSGVASDQPGHHNHHSKTHDLDGFLAGLNGGIIPHAMEGPPAGAGGIDGLPLDMLMGNADGPGTISIAFGPDPMSMMTPPDDGQSMMMFEGPGAGGPDPMDLSDFRGILGGHTSHHHASPSMSVDPFMKDIFDAMDATIAQELLPIGHRHHELPCEEDEKQFCPKPTNGPPVRSPLTCLGANADKVSEKCKKDVKMSLPFNCADEISDGCDGVDEAIITCLSKRAADPKGKPIRDTCKSSLEVTKSLIHKVNTMQSTVSVTSALNQSHISKTKTTRSKDTHDVSEWTCPSAFTREAGKTCCAAGPTEVYPRLSCVTAGGLWNLMSLDAAHGHGGMECCPPASSLVSRTKTKPVPKATGAPKVPEALVLPSTKAPQESAKDSSPWGSPPTEHEVNGRSMIAIIALSILFGMAMRSVAPGAVVAGASRMGVPTSWLKHTPTKTGNFAFQKPQQLFSMTEEPSLDAITMRRDTNEYGTLG